MTREALAEKATGADRETPKGLFDAICGALVNDAEAQRAIRWQESVTSPTDAGTFAGEAIWVICNSGMKNTVARLIHDRVWEALRAGEPVVSRFKHTGKAGAIDTIWRERERLYAAFLAAPDKLAFLETLPWIGSITKYHLAKNFGVDCAKPDVHLQRLATRSGKGVQALCAELASQTGYRVATVDLILWWGCAHGIVDSRTGRLTSRALLDSARHPDHGAVASDGGE